MRGQQISMMSAEVNTAGASHVVTAGVTVTRVAQQSQIVASQIVAPQRATGTLKVLLA